MPRKVKNHSGGDLVESTLSELTALIRDLSPQAHVEISFEHYEDEDAHINVFPPPALKPEEVRQVEGKLGERCNEILLDTGLFIIGAVCD